MGSPGDEGSAEPMSETGGRSSARCPSGTGQAQACAGGSCPPGCDCPKCKGGACPAGCECPKCKGGACPPGCACPKCKGDGSELQIGLVGRENVGKSALICKFVKGENLSDYIPTEYEVCTHEMTVNGKKMMVRIGDAGGGPNNSDNMDKNIMESSCFILVYDITNRETFDEMQKIRAHITQLKKQEPPMILVGNKSDLNEQRAVQTKDGTTLSQSMHCRFFETSTMTGANVSEAFMAVVSEVQGKKVSAKAKKGCCVML
ncbi:hypothetical protein BsWGS_09642 [Bradybaena similaris]